MHKFLATWIDSFCTTSCRVLFLAFAFCCTCHNIIVGLETPREAEILSCNIDLTRRRQVVVVRRLGRADSCTLRHMASDLRSAILANDLERVKRLIAQWPELARWVRKSYTKSSESEVVESLFRRSDINPHSHGKVPLHYACEHDKAEMVELLLDEEKRTRPTRPEIEIPTYNRRDHMGKTPVFGTGSSKIVELLLQFDDLEMEMLETGFIWGAVTIRLREYSYRYSSFEFLRAAR